MAGGRWAAALVLFFLRPTNDEEGDGGWQKASDGLLLGGFSHWLGCWVQWLLVTGLLLGWARLFGEIVPSGQLLRPGGLLFALPPKQTPSRDAGPTNAGSTLSGLGLGPWISPLHSLTVRKGTCQQAAPRTERGLDLQVLVDFCVCMYKYLLRVWTRESKGGDFSTWHDGDLKGLRAVGQSPGFKPTLQFSASASKVRTAVRW
jgi:hypothetical protein